MVRVSDGLRWLGCGLVNRGVGAHRAGNAERAAVGGRIFE